MLRKLATETLKPVTTAARSLTTSTSTPLGQVGSQKSIAPLSRLSEFLTESDLRAAQSLSSATSRHIQFFDNHELTNCVGIIRPASIYSNNHPPIMLIKHDNEEFSYGNSRDVGSTEHYSLEQIQQRETTLKGLMTDEEINLIQQFSQEVGRPVHINGGGTGHLYGIITNDQFKEEKTKPVIFLLHRSYDRVNSHLELKADSEPHKERFNFSIYLQNIEDGGSIEDLHDIYDRFLAKHGVENL